MKNLLMKAKTKMNGAIVALKYGLKYKTAGDSHFMSVLVTVIIVLVIAVMFKSNVSTIFTSFFEKATTQINGLFP